MLRSFALLLLTFSFLTSVLGQTKAPSTFENKNLLVAAGRFAGAQAAQKITVPKTKGSPILIDGIFSPDEWKEAKIIDIDPSTKLYFQQYRDHVFIGIKNADAVRYTDIFLADSGSEIYNLHASMQIGERELSGDAWTDGKPAWNWGNHRDWTANEAKTDSTKNKNAPLAEQVFPREGVEFQIRRSRFKSNQWRIRIETRDFAGKLPDIIFPQSSDRKSTERWLILDLK